jgi:hypothetical protein
MNALFNRILLASGLATLAVLVGCAHPITINPQVNNITGSGTARVDKSVAYYVSPENMKLEVTTDGGGGDKISYFPYRDLDTSIYKSLSEVYTNVVKLEAPTAAAGANGPALIFAPTFVTKSSSSSALTWPATDFSVEMTCKVTDASGAPVTSIAVTGAGKAEFSEFKADFALSSRRASEDTMKKFVKALETTPQVR